MKHKFYSVAGIHLGESELNGTGLVTGAILKQEFPAMPYCRWEVLAVRKRSDESLDVILTPHWPGNGDDASRRQLQSSKQ